MEEFNGERFSEGLTSRDIRLLLTVSTKTGNTSTVHPGTHDPTSLPVSWPLIVHSFIINFTTDCLLANEHHTVTSARIKQSETEMDFTERLRDMARSF